MQRLKIDFLKFTGAKRFMAKDGTEFVAIPLAANNIFIGTKTLSGDVTLMDNRDGPDQYDNDGFASVDVGKARREAGERGPIIGNWKHIGERRSPNQNTAPPPTTDHVGNDDVDDIPF
jgi:hypothetical protein